MTLSAEGTCHSRRAPPTASRKVCRKTSSVVNTTSSTISLARLNRRASSVPPSSSEASTGCFLSLRPLRLRDQVAGDRTATNDCATLARLVSFRGRRYTIRSLRRQTMSVALRQVNSVTGHSLEARKRPHGGDSIEQFNRDYIEIACESARRAGAVAVLQRQPAPCTRGDPAIHRDLWSAGDLRGRRRL